MPEHRVVDTRNMSIVLNDQKDEFPVITARVLFP
jgi:hypothetical protein